MIDSDDDMDPTSGSDPEPGEHDGQEADFQAAGLGAGRKTSNTGSWLLLLACAVGAAAMFLMFTRGPRAAKASPLDPANQAGASINQFLADGSKNVAALRQLLQGTQKVVAQFASYPNTPQVPLHDLRSNPFEFVSAAPAPSDAPAAPPRTDEDHAGALKAVEALELQTIMNGSERACMISGKLCAEGDQIQGFIVDKIKDGSVIVRRGAYRFELRIQQ